MACCPREIVVYDNMTHHFYCSSMTWENERYSKSYSDALNIQWEPYMNCGGNLFLYLTPWTLSHRYIINVCLETICDQYSMSLYKHYTNAHVRCTQPRPHGDTLKQSFMTYAKSQQGELSTFWLDNGGFTKFSNIMIVPWSQETRINYLRSIHTWEI